MVVCLYRRMGKNGASDFVSWSIKFIRTKCHICSDVAKADRVPYRKNIGF